MLRAKCRWRKGSHSSYDRVLKGIETMHWKMGACAAATLAGFWMMWAQDKPNPNFTGGAVTTITENSDGKIAHYRFPPGVRTKWHMHEGGQIILVEEGVGRAQIKGGPVIELHAGETTYAPPGVWHWHGAAPDKGGTQFNIARGSITWGDEVTEKEFTAKPKK
jgi:quercetin dioxygenase-like cupin family protein